MPLTVTTTGCQGLFQNYINNRPNGADGAAGLGLGHQGATGLNLFFQWFCYGMSLQHHRPCNMRC